MVSQDTGCRMPVTGIWHPTSGIEYEIARVATATTSAFERPAADQAYFPSLIRILRNQHSS
jgi:hypothetical protein